MKTAAVTVTYQHLPPSLSLSVSLSLSLSLSLCFSARSLAILWKWQLPVEDLSGDVMKRLIPPRLSSGWVFSMKTGYFLAARKRIMPGERYRLRPFSFLFRPAPFEKQFRRHSRGQTARLSGRRVRPGKTQRESEGGVPPRAATRVIITRNGSNPRADSHSSVFFERKRR